MTDVEAPNIIKISPKSKYVFVFDGHDNVEDYRKISEIVKTWWEDKTNPFLFIWGCKLEKIETTEEQNDQP